MPLAHALARAGKRVALAERERLGGSCVNFGCTPTKAVIASARVAHLARRAFEFGLTIPRVEVNFPAVLERAKAIATQSRAALRQGMQHSDNPMLLRGHARFVGRKGRLFRLRVDSKRVTAGQVVLNTGTRSLFPRIPGVNATDALVLHAGNWLEKPELPAHLAVLGASYTGLEMAQFYRRMGSRVTVVDHGAQITQREDPDVALALMHFLESEDIAFRLNTRLTKVRRKSGRLGLHVRVGGRRFLVVGVMKPKGLILGFDIDDAAYVPTAAAMGLFNMQELSEINLTFSPQRPEREVKEGIRRILMARHDGEEDFTITTQTEMLDTMNRVMNVVTMAVGGIGAISLLVGAIGILTMMWIAVGERTSEIGLAKALGASRGQIVRLFLVEAALLSLAGGLIGVAAGMGIGAALRLALPALPLSTAPEFVLLALAVSLAVGLAAGVLPARRAASLDPVEALRAE